MYIPVRKFATLGVPDASVLIESNKTVATSVQRDPVNRGPEEKCANCGHPEREHGATGTRPCLATVGNLLNPDFCSCDEFRPKLVKAA